MKNFIDDEYEQDIGTRINYERQQTDKIGFELPADNDIDQDEVEHDVEDDEGDDIDNSKEENVDDYEDGDDNTGTNKALAVVSKELFKMLKIIIKIHY